MILWKFKWVLLILGLGAAYWYGNPQGRFGFSRHGLVVFDRVPVFFFDLYVNFDKEKQPLDNLRDPKMLNYWWNSSGPALRKMGDAGRVLLVGTGFGEEPSFNLEQTYVDSLENTGVRCQQMPSPDAIKLYNNLCDQNKQVAILLRIRS